MKKDDRKIKGWYRESGLTHSKLSTGEKQERKICENSAFSLLEASISHMITVQSAIQSTIRNLPFIVVYQSTVCNPQSAISNPHSARCNPQSIL